MKHVRKMATGLLIAAMALPAALHAKTYKEGDTLTAFNGAEIYIKQERSRVMTLIAQAQLFNLECSTGDAFRVGLGLEGDYFLPKLGSVHAEYVGTYFNVQKLSAKTLNLGSNDVSGFSLFEVGGRFHFVDKQGRARHKIILSSNTEYSGTTQITTTHYIKAKLPCRRIWAARGGFYHTTAPVTTDMNKSELAEGDFGAVRTKDGTVLSNAYWTNDHTNGFYLGLSSIINMSIRHTNNVRGYAGDTYFTSFFREIYADALIASTSFDPFVVGTKSHDVEANTKGSFQTSNIGWRLGKKMIFTRKKVNMGFSFELGNRPGVTGRGMFFGTGFTLAYVK